MTGWQHPNPTVAGPGEIVGIYPIELSPEESELVNNHLSRAQANYPISHYIKAKYFLDVLHLQTISAKRLDLYEDTSEGLYPEANRHFDSPFVRGMPAIRDRNAFMVSQAIHRMHCYAHCWFGMPEEDLDMWEDFGDLGKGVLMVSSTHRLLTSIIRDGKLFYELGVVTYWPDDKPIPDLHSSTVMFRKQPKFSDENEVRLLTQIRRNYLPKNADGSLDECPERLPIKVQLDTLVGGIILGPRMVLEDQRDVIEAIQAKLPQAKVSRSRFDLQL